MSSSDTEFEQSQPGVKVLVLLGSPFLYGIEGDERVYSSVAVRSSWVRIFAGAGKLT